ncbi:tyrosine-type recombinase/integrase [Paracraurococcus ruber]|uniref:Site-specific recombinase XerD n=1 Tax=Paracraurococcus ruber TaxID=77675 RepID=A0ABS1CWX4_9PROT|nr:tyrosine-type recombinase/integrase [Paracraurococcus ruber]MBK1658234.1 hypothetical protein [Paracraurococcus ruber]TDG30603.1 hypothetical protein E2C05_13810 [Paracraurococcus ruber]
MADFLELQRRRWYAVWDVPQDCRHAFNGKKRLKLSLGVDSRREALARVGPVVAGWKRTAEQARGGGDSLAARASFFREALAKAADQDEREAILDQIGDLADQIDPGPLEGQHGSHDDRPDASRFYGLATGKLIEIAPMVEPWLASRHVAEKTKAMDRSTVKLLVARHRTVQEVDRKAASRFTEQVLGNGRKAATVRRMVTGLSAFWLWLQNRGDYPENQRSPWEGQAPAKPRGRGVFSDNDADRRPFTEQEARHFTAAVDARAAKHPVDAEVVRIMAVTGARLEEVCALACSDIRVVNGVAWLTVREGKTAAASRRIPVVAPEVLEALQARLKAPALPLFPELKKDRYGNRSAALSKRLGRLLRKAVTDKDLVAAHGWRHRARTLAEHGGIEPWIADAFIGHERPGEGLSRYSKGPSDADLLRMAWAIPLP